MLYSYPCRLRTRRNSGRRRSLSPVPHHMLHNISIVACILHPKQHTPLCIGKYPAASAIAPTSTPIRGPRLSISIPAGIPMAYAPTLPAAPFTSCYFLLGSVIRILQLTIAFDSVAVNCMRVAKSGAHAEYAYYRMLSETMGQYAAIADIHWFRKQMQCRSQPPRTLSGLFSSDPPSC